VKERDHIRPAATTGGALAHIVAGRKLDILDATRERRDVEREVDVRGPALAGAYRTIADGAQQITQDRNAHQAEAGERIRHRRHTQKGLYRPSAPATQAAFVARCCIRGGPMHGDEIGAAFKTLHQLRQMFRRLGEVTLQQHHRVATRILIVGGNVPHECIDAAGVALVLVAPNHGERHDSAIRLQHVRSAVRAGIVEHHHVVLPGKALKHRPEPPEEDADCGGFVVDRDADAEHVGRVAGAQKSKREV
jgi:hypothetical protein